MSLRARTIESTLRPVAAVEDELFLLGQTQTLRDIVLEDVSDAGRRGTTAEALAKSYMAKNARQTADKPMRSIVSALSRYSCRAVADALRLQMLQQIVRKLLDGDCLSYDEVIDLLVLRDSYDGTADDALTALKLFAQIPAPVSHGSVTKHCGILAHVAFPQTSTGLGLSEMRRSDLLRTIWRSIYLRDDWQALGETAHLTDDQVRSRLAETICAKVIGAMQRGSSGVSLDYLLLPDAAAYAPSTETLRIRTDGQGTEAYLEEIQGEVYTLRTRTEQTQIDQMVQSMVRATG